VAILPLAGREEWTTVNAMIKYLLGFVAATLLLGTVQASPVSVGEPAPQVVAQDQDGKPVKFEDVYAKGMTLVYFYPKAFTGGCTAEACSLRDSYERLSGQGLQIIGVSRDTSARQKEFQTSNKIPFMLIGDPNGDVAKAFGVPSIPVLDLDSRMSFIVKDGKVAWSSLNAQTSGSAAEVQKALDKLKG
jgi:peroxiredoxin Q/BCP